MNYGCQIWGQNMHPQFAKIITLQKRAMRIIKFADFEAHSDPLFKEMKVLRIQDLIKLQNCLFVHDFLNKNYPFASTTTLRQYLICTQKVLLIVLLAVCLSPLQHS